MWQILLVLLLSLLSSTDNLEVKKCILKTVFFPTVIRLTGEDPREHRLEHFYHIDTYEINIRSITFGMGPT
jgi:hypothetical protein